MDEQQRLARAAQEQQEQKQPARNEWQQSSISSSSSSVLTNSSASPSSQSLTSIPTNSPTNFSNSQSARSASISLNSAASDLGTSYPPVMPPPPPMTTTTTTTTTTAAANELQQPPPQQQQQSPLNTQQPLAAAVVSMEHAIQHAKAAAPEPFEAMDGATAEGMLLLLGSSPSEGPASEFLGREGGGNDNDGSSSRISANVDIYPSDGRELGPVNGSGVVSESARLERSNSCSQAECAAAIVGAQGLSPDALVGGAAAASILCGQATSISHENLTTQGGAIDATSINDPSHHPHSLLDQRCSVASSSSTGQLFPALDRPTPLSAQRVDPANARLSDNDSRSVAHASLAAAAPTTTTTTTTTAAQQFGSSTSRFFSSKLNTGSLWSLLSVGSTSSTNEAEPSGLDPSSSSLAPDSSKHDKQQQQQQQHQQPDNTNRSTGGFFSRVQPFRRQQQQQPPATQGHATFQPLNQQQAAGEGQQKEASSTVATTTTTTTTEANPMPPRQAAVVGEDRKRPRFNVKYIGSALLHKNFTLPMLEWISKDIKRQTIRGAQSTSQRQFTIPARDIVLEIQSYQLNAISCKDGHCLFVHPMHCVSKYAQLQHDPTCFSYLIRDNKESPYFCHVFQAKSANKVHDIFSAIREATTRTKQQQQSSMLAAPAASFDHHNQQQQQQRLHNQTSGGGGSAIQKSASSDGSQSSSKSLFDRSQVKLPSTPPLAGGATQPSLVKPLLSGAAGSTAGGAGGGGSTQFENSYQFEVMFVKKVKLQCRRVPATFVDDALETLKSFEVHKGGAESKAAQIKGIVGKRIINASVDERQEYDEACQSPTPSAAPPGGGHSRGPTAGFPPSSIPKLIADGTGVSEDDDAFKRRGSSVSPNRAATAETALAKNDTARESRSCQQSPTKSTGQEQHHQQHPTTDGPVACVIHQQQHHQSMDCLKSIDCTIRSAKEGVTPNYTNDFSPYNTITSNDLNERIAAIPVVSSSVSLDHETRQKLARQVRETIMATAANIKKGVYASGDKLDSSASSKALDSLSCTVTSSVPFSIDEHRPSSSSSSARPAAELEGDGFTAAAAADLNLSSEHFQEGPPPRTPPGGGSSQQQQQQQQPPPPAPPPPPPEQRRSSATATIQQQAATASNNFDLFRRASARQVVKNRTMLLLIGKDELCTISIDKHQMLFSKSFNSIVHCLQGNNNKDHFGLICRDSGKINPNAEAYAGFIFKCQSDKVVREIMGALRQVIYSSQHNYHGHNSPYNPLNVAANPHHHQYKQPAPAAAQHPAGQPERLAVATTTAGSAAAAALDSSSRQQQRQLQGSLAGGQLSLAAKRGFLNSIELDEASRHSAGARQAATTRTQATTAALEPATAPTSSQHQGKFSSSGGGKAHNQPQNLIKNMFCDNCPLYWFHRLCCDIESLPAEASKSIILRRIDSSLSDKEQDELYSRFSEFTIESIDEHNEIFMSLLRHQCERKQLKHNQSNLHLSAMAKQQQQQQAANQSMSSPMSSSSAAATAGPAANNPRPASGHHQRSGSTSGSLASFGIGGGGGGGQSSTTSAANQAGQSFADAGSAAIDNLKKAKNSISVSIENILKRRASMKQGSSQQDEQQPLEIVAGNMPTRSGSFRSSSRESHRGANGGQGASSGEAGGGASDPVSNLKRSQSSSEYSNGLQRSINSAASSWKDSFSRTINDDLTIGPLVGLFRRRSSTFGSNDPADNEPMGSSSNNNRGSNNMRTSAECLNNNNNNSSSGRSTNAQQSPAGQSGSPVIVGHPESSRFSYNNNNGGASPSSMLSSAFWKKSIFDKIRQPVTNEQSTEQQQHDAVTVMQQATTVGEPRTTSPLLVVGGASGEQLAVAAKRSREELRSLWRKAILEQITLLKMDRQNQCLQANTVECNIQRIKLNYKDVAYGREVLALWDKLLKQDPTRKVEFVEVARLVRIGVPKQRRGEIWMFLMNQYQLRHGTSFQSADSEFTGDANQTYRSLLSQLSVQQHEIFVDIGRTFPSHPYYSQYLSIGQLSLFNLLKAYSLLDPEVGYCQGLSFVAGILLLHVDSEDEAFELFRHLLFNFGLRKQYLPSMNALHLQLYQITRLLRDHEYELFNHFDHHDISPSLYAAPWFLTLFASQFPLGFVARLLDLIFLIGIEAIFRVSLNLLNHHRNSLLNCHSLESTMDFMRSDLVNIEDDNLVKIFDKSMSLDLRNKLIEYEIEYTFYCAEDRARAASGAHTALNQHHHHQHSTYNHPSTLKVNPNPSSCDTAGFQESSKRLEADVESTSVVADATATVIIQHLLANNHLKSLRSNYSY